MFTQCPECQTTFRVSAAMLKAAQGRVRCGRCESVFDALTFLMEQRQASLTSDVDDAGEIDLSAEDLSADDDADADDVPESALECHLSADDLGKVFVVAPAPTLKRPMAGAPPAPMASPAAKAAVETDDDETAEHEILQLDGTESADVEVITLEGDTVESKDIKLDPEKAKPKAESRQEAQARIDAEVRREIEAAFAADPTTRAEFTLPSGRRITLTHDEPEIPDAEEVLTRSRERFRLSITPSRWLAGSAVLGLLLVVQLVHANRQSIVRSPTFGPALGAIYASLGAELTPAWDVRAYELRQWGAAADPGTSGTLRVRASLLNGADHAQPYPLLRLTLQDRFGSEVATRALEPREYLHSDPGSNDLLGAGERIDAEIAIVDPGKDAVGFEIDVCLRDPNGLKCASEQARNSG
jgi:predicted Zn finger-like uncharacterized protein